MCVIDAEQGLAFLATIQTVVADDKQVRSSSAARRTSLQYYYAHAHMMQWL